MAQNRTQERIVIEAFRYMIAHGEAVLTHVSVPLDTGGTLEKNIYKVKPK